MRQLLSCRIFALIAVAVIQSAVSAAQAPKARATQSTQQPTELASLSLPSAPETVGPGPALAGPGFARPTPIESVAPVQKSQDLHRFWDRQNDVLFAATGAAATADFFVTHSNLSGGGREYNPLVRPFAHNTAALAGNFALETAGVIGISYMFHRSGHHKLERLTSILDASLSGGAVAYGLLH